VMGRSHRDLLPEQVFARENGRPGATATLTGSDA
jgi:hypothetical protein